MTDDCPTGLAARRILNSSLTESPEAFPVEEIELEENQPRSEYQVGSLVKIIDPIEHHSEWGVFEVVEVKHNDHHFNNTYTYLNTHEWLYRLVTLNHEDTYSNSLWVGENEICHFDQSHIICTEEIF
jgi:hypothetical protein